MEKVSTPQNISQRVSSLRSRLGLSQEQFAEAIGFSRNYVSMAENGRPMGKGFVSAVLTLERQHGIQSEHAADNSPRGALRAALLKRGMTAADLAKKIGYHIGPVQGVVENGSRLSEAMAEKIVAALPELDLEMLLGGSETPVVRSATGIYGTAGAKPEITPPPGSKIRMIPLISMTQAGPCINFGDETFQQDAIAVVDVKDSKAFALAVRGNSMTPEINEGDVVIVCPSWEPRAGDEVICRTIRGDVMCKIYQTKFKGQFIILSSYNPAYPPIELSRDEIEWIYPVQGVQRTRRRD